MAHERVSRHYGVQEAHAQGFLCGEDPAREQQVGGVGQADDARQHPGKAELGGKIKAPVGGGEFGPLGGEPQVGEGREHQADAGRRSVEGGDHRLVQAEVVGEAGVEARIDAVAGFLDILAHAGIVAPLFRVALESREVGPGAERAALRVAGHDDDAHARIDVRLHQR